MMPPMQLAQVPLLSSVMCSCLAFSHINAAALDRSVLFGTLAACTTLKSRSADLGTDFWPTYLRPDYAADTPFGICSRLILHADHIGDVLIKLKC